MNAEILTEMEQICEKQYDEIRRKKTQLLDLEEEIRLAARQNTELQLLLEKRNQRIDELGKWCTHLQTKIDEYEIKVHLYENKIKEFEEAFFFRNAKKFKHFFKKIF